MSRLFGSVDTEEVRELKISQLEHRIAQAEDAVKQFDEDLTYVIKLIIWFQYELSLELCTITALIIIIC